VKQNKVLKVLATSALLASVVAPFGAGVVSANSNNQVDKILKVSTNAKLTGSSSLIIAEDDTEFGVSTSDTFRVTLPSGVTWNTGAVADGGFGKSSGIEFGSGDDNNYAVAEIVTDQVMEVRLKGKPNGTAKFFGKEDGADSAGQVKIPLKVKLNGASGELKVKVDAMDSTVTSGSYTFAVASSGKTVATVDDVKNIGKNGTGGQIRIEENATGAVSGNQTLKLKLPSNFKWNGMDEQNDAKTAYKNITLGGGWATGTVDSVSGSDNELTVVLKGLPTTSDSRGYLYVTPKIKANSDASYGDVTVSISGGDFSDADVVVAKYGDYGVTLKVESVEELTAGKFDENTKTAKITIEEATPGSLVAGRDIDVQFPSWVKVVDISDWAVSGAVEAKKPGVGKDKEVDGTDDNFSITIDKNDNTSTTKGKIEFKVRLSVEANKTGDIEATVGGAGVADQKVVVAKAIAPAAASLEGEAGKFKIGAQDQAAPVFYITEAKKGTFEKSQETGYGGDGEITVKLPTGVKFSKVPTVEVVEGDGTIDTANVRRTNDDNVLSIPVKGESITKPMKIKVSNVLLTLDRTVAEGPIQAKIGGSAVVENYTTSKGWIETSIYTGGSSNAMDPGEFNTQNAVTFTLGSTVTPAPGDTTASNIVFKLNSKTYTVDGKEFEMDAAPLVGWDRAYLPVRFAANALNVSDDQIIWDDKTSTFTVFKGDRVVSGKVGDKFLTVNGAKVPMDVPVWRNKAQTNDRVMVPIRYLANALNANIEWNKETSEITIEAAK
jgi:hypothetical protein